MGAKVARAAGLEPERERVLAHARALVGHGRYLDAIEFAAAKNRRLRDATIDRQVVMWRNEAFGAISHPPGRADWPPVIPDLFPAPHGVPEIHGAQALNSERLGGAILHHGALIVRELLTQQEAAPFLSGIEKALAAHDRLENGAPKSDDRYWYAPFPVQYGSRLHYCRAHAEKSGCLLSADSPRNLADIVAMIHGKAVDRAIEGYLGERPALSIGKSTLRRALPSDAPGDWHQDGAFLGESIRTVNFWLCLSHCGEESPGLSMLERRLSRIVETGTHGARYDWSVGDHLALQLAEGRPTASRVFAPGDAVFFDQLLLHRTAGRPGLTKARYAIESWFFAPSTYPAEWGPLVI